MFEKGSYVLIPIEENTAKVFLPVDIAEKRIRSVMNTDDAWRLIKEIKAVDERYFKLAEKQLYSELAFALGVEKSELNEIIEQNIG